MFNKIDTNVYESENGYIVEFQRVDKEKAAFVGKRNKDDEIRLLFILSAEGMTRNELLDHLEENFDAYLEKYVK